MADGGAGGGGGGGGGAGPVEEERTEKWFHTVCGGTCRWPQKILGATEGCGPKNLNGPTGKNLN